MNCCKRIIDEIRRLNVPGKIKAELVVLASQARQVAIPIIRFIKRHRRFGEAMILGVLAAYLLTHIPWFGKFLALCALVTAAAIGLMRELREDLTQLFATDAPAQV